MQTTNKSITKKLFTIICAFVMMFGICGFFGFKGLNASAVNERSIIVSPVGKTFNITVNGATRAISSARFIIVKNVGQGGKFIVQVSSLQGVAQLVRKGDVHFKDRNGRDVMILHIKQTRSNIIPSTKLITLQKNPTADNVVSFKITSDMRYTLAFDNRYLIKTSNGQVLNNGTILGANGKKITSFQIKPRVANNTGKSITTYIKIKPVGEDIALDEIKVVQLAK